ncbi:MAG: FG-GAP-like repeat-containing protein [Bacteroidota bacterium]
MGFLLLVGVIIQPVEAQVYVSDATNTFFTGTPIGLYDGSLEWGDFDADGDLDILATGRAGTVDFRTIVYEFNSITQTFSNFTGADNMLDLYLSDAEFGDYDNDGDLDVAICGKDLAANRHTKIYYFDETQGIFREDSTASPCLAGVENGDLAWGDYNNDGLLDLVVMGRNATGLQTQVYRNEGFGVFVPTNAIAPGVESGEVIWADVDNDSYLDLLYTGANASGSAVTRLFLNNQDGTFSFQPSGLQNAKLGSIDVSDYDTDGDLDILLTGATNLAGTSLISRVYTNQGGGAFFNLNAGITAIKHGTAEWGDFNNDGRPDIVLSGADGNGTADRITEIYVNQSGSSFQLQGPTSNALSQLNGNASVAWGYVNSDEKIDLLLSGTVGNNTHTFKLFLNTEPTTDVLTPPTPNSLSETISGNTATLNWNTPNGSYGAALKPGLTYNLFIGTQSGTDDVVPGMADLSTGVRRVVQLGSIKEESWEIGGLDPGNYTWRVQSIDPGFEASGFSSQGSFTITGSLPLSHFADVTGATFGGLSPAGMGDAATAWVDIDGDGDQDFMMSGLVSDLEPNSIDFRTRIFRNDGGSLNEIPGSLGLPNVYQASIEWGDVNLDNLPDVILSGTSATGRVTEVFVNQGNGFVSLNAGMEAVTNGSLDLGDYDKDGDLDLLLTGSGTGTVTKVYENRYIPTQTLSFQEDASASQDLTNVFGGDAKWGDYDQDGFPDVLLTGNDGNGSLVGELFRNDGAGGFSVFSPANVPSVWRSSVAWADVNNDGLLDMVIAGDLSSNSTTPNPAVFFKKQEDNAGITFPQSGSLPGRAGGSVDLGDYNDDGYVDLLLTGQGIDTVHYSEVFLNNTSESNPAFLLEPLASDILRGVNLGSAASWGDYDSDGKLDIFLTGILRGGGKISRLYENIESTNNVVPNIPQNLSVEPAGFNVKVTWDAPNAPGNQEDGYTYAVFVRKLGAPTDSLAVSPEANLSNGIRFLTEEGKAGSATELLIKNLVPGLYEWTVQAVAQDLESSAFAARDTFTYENPSFEEQTANFFPLGNPPIGLVTARMAFGDFRNNGSLDLIAVGESNTNPYETVLYQYDPATDKFSVSPFTSSFIDVREGSVDWGDFNNDGDADVLITGLSAAGRVGRIYENNGASFQSGGFYNLPGGGVSNGHAAFGDFNNDGFDDIFITGTDISGSESSRFLRNNGNETYTDLGNLGVEELTNSWADWGDINNDGYLDLAVIGYNGSNARTRIYLNQQDETFLTYAGTPFTNVQNGTIEFGDFNSDGFLDLGYTGTNAAETQRITEIWRNNGDLTFSGAGDILDGAGYGSLDWADYDDDGYQDLIITGQNGPNSSDRVIRLYRYDAGLDALVYEIIGSSVFAGVNNGSDAAWADVDQDGKLDLMIAGEQDGTANGGTFLFYQNINTLRPNITPGPPSKLAEVIQGYEVLLGWDAPSNVEDSILAGISYNVYVGTSPGAVDRRSPNAVLGTGARKLVARGVVSDTTSFRLLNLPPGKYYWSVQAIDADFEPSIFAVEDSFEYLPPTFQDVTNQAFSGFPDGISEGSMEWGDFDEDGFLDLIAVGNSSAGAVALLYKNNGDGTFASISPTFPPLLHTDISLQDVDRDGKLDFLLQGETFGGQILTGLYQNSGSDVFTLVNSGIDSLTMGASAWTDLDRDGLPDLAIMGSDGTEPQLKVYRQTTAGDFEEIAGPFVGLEKGDLKWIDYNKDGFWDLLATGDNDQGDSEIYLYQYDGNLGFTEINNTFIPASLGGLDIGDFDNDGWADFLLSGVDNSGVRAVRVYQNQNGSGTFNLFDAFLDTAGIERGEARWADYDDNGRLDIVVVGQSSTGRTAQVIRNQLQAGQPVFELREIAALPLQPSEDATMAWGDFNNDGKVDLAISGEQFSAPPIRGIRLYQNIDSTANLPAPTPSSLDFIQVSDTIILTWNLPAGSEGLTSNLYVQTPAGTVDIISPLADPTTGKGFVATRGNAGQRRTYQLYNLENGTYNWSVQSIDHDYEHSPWASQSQFDFTAPDLVENNLNYLDLQGNIPTGFSHGDLAWADYDGDADLDLLISGETGDGTASTVLLENSDGVFRADQTVSTLFPNLRYSALAWTDYNQDGAPDVLIAGETGASGGPGNGEFTTSLFLNDGNGGFSLDPKGAKFPDLTLAAIAWADFDQDGDQDVVMSGRTAFGAETILYTNQDSVFLPYPYIDLIPVEAGALAWEGRRCPPRSGRKWRPGQRRQELPHLSKQWHPGRIYPHGNHRCALDPGWQSQPRLGRFGTRWLIRTLVDRRKSR